MGKSVNTELWGRFGELMVQTARADEPYLVGIKVLGCVVDAITRSVDASSVYRIWGELTDRYEQRPEDRGETETLMRRD